MHSLVVVALLLSGAFFGAPDEPVATLRIVSEVEPINPEDVAGLCLERQQTQTGLFLTLTESGREKFARVMGANIGKALEFFVGNQILTGPAKIHDPITGEMGTIIAAGEPTPAIYEAVEKLTGAPLAECN